MAIVEDKVVGFCGCGKSQSKDMENCGEVFALYVLKEYQNKKIGYALMQEALKRLVEFPEIVLWVLRGNEKAINFYKKVGFAFEGTTQEINLGSVSVEERMVLHKV